MGDLGQHSDAGVDRLQLSVIELIDAMVLPDALQAPPESLPIAQQLLGSPFQIMHDNLLSSVSSKIVGKKRATIALVLKNVAESQCRDCIGLLRAVFVRNRACSIV